MGPEQGKEGKDRTFKAPETGQVSSPEGQDAERLAKIKEAYSKEYASASANIMWENEIRQVQSAISGGKECPGNWMVIAGKTPEEAARLLANQVLTRHGTVAALEMSELPEDKKAEILAEYYDSYAKAVEEHPHVWGMGENEKVNREMIEESKGSASLLRGEESAALES